MSVVSAKSRWRIPAVWAVVLAGAVGLYALAGYLLVPHVAQKVLWPLLSETLGGQLQARGIFFNPFGFSLKLDGVSLRSPEGSALGKIERIEIDPDLAASLRVRALVAEIRVDRPAVDIVFDQHGRPNYGFLTDQSSKKSSKAETLPFLLTAATIEGGRLTIEDRSRGKEARKSFQGLDLALEGLGTATKERARFTVRAGGEGNEKLAAEGFFELTAMALEGKAEVENLGLSFLSDWLAPGLAYSVASGALTLNAEFRYSGQTGIEWAAEEANIKDLKLNHAGQPFLDVPSVEARSFSFLHEAEQAKLESLKMQDTVLHRPTAVRAGSILVTGVNYSGQPARIDLDTVTSEKTAILSNPPVELDSLNGQGLSYDLEAERLDWRTLGVKKAVTGSSDAVELESVQAEDLSFLNRDNRVGIKSLSAGRLKLGQGSQPLIESGALAARRFAFALDKSRLALERLDLEDLQFKAPTPIVDRQGNARQFLVEALALDGLGVDIPNRLLEIASIRFDRSFVAAWLDKDGKTGFAGMSPKNQTPSGADAAISGGGEPWRFRLGRIQLGDNTVLLRDFRFDPPVKTRLTNLNLLVKGFDSGADKPFWLELDTGLSMGGRIALNGQAGFARPAANLKLQLEDLSLPAFQPYLDPFVRFRVVKGKLNTDADIVYETEAGGRLRIGGDVFVADFASDDKREGKDFVNWKGARFEGLIYENAPSRLSVRSVAFTEPYVLAVIGPGQEFNVAENFAPPGTDKSGKTQNAALSKDPAGRSSPPSLLIGELKIHRGNADFSDLTIKPTPFWAGIHDLNGNIRSLSSRSDAKSDVFMEGKLNQGSTVNVFGKINPFSPMAYTDVTMAFRGVNLTTLSPFSAKFAGYRIDKGKLNMDLRYRLEGGQLTAENNFMLEQLVLGERVESPDATTLPVRFAVSLLKDADGRINVELPISGDLGNPDASLKQLLAEAAKNFIRNIVTSPLAILAGLRGEGDQQVEAVKFAPGAAVLSIPEKDKLAAIAKAMKNRPELNLDIKAAAQPELDRPALAELDLARQLKNAKLIESGRRRKGQKIEWDGVHLSEEDYSRLLTNLYRWKYPDAPELQGLDSGTALSGHSLKSARETLLRNWTVSELGLRALAEARGESIRRYLVQDQGLSDRRIFLLRVDIGPKEAREIKAMLTLGGS